MISIIIPVFNQANKIGNTFESVLKQSEKPIEVIAVNDGSRDQVVKVFELYAKKFSEKDIPSKFFSQENKGAPAARNRGFKESVGEYIFFCDADATLKPEALATMKKTLDDHPEASYVYSSFLWGKKLFKVGPFSSDKLKTGPCIHTMALIRRSDFPKTGWDESIKKLQDWDLWLTMLDEGKNGLWIDRILFTVSPGGTISNWLPSFAYKLMPFLPQVKKYQAAVANVKAKHNLQ